MSDDLLLLDIRDNVATLTLNRPAKKNSLSPDLVKRLSDAFDDLAAGDTIPVVVIRGFGSQAFCAGYDIGSLPTRGSGDPSRNLKKLDAVENLFKTVVNYPMPVVAMINGAAFGAGCELSVCCDIRVGAEDIRMGMPPAKLGLVYPWSGLQRFLQVVGLKNIREIFYTGRSYQGKRLKEIGLVDYLVPRSELEAFTYKMAAEIAANAPLALKGTKRVLNLLLGGLQPPGGSRREAELLTEGAFRSEDLREGQRAFLEKRKPVFRGK